MKLCIIFSMLVSGAALAAEQDPFSIGAANCRVVNTGPRPNERITWSGGCKDGFADGAGVLQWYVDEQPGSRFEGGMARGRPHGAGLYVYASGSRYEGEFAHGEREGRGILTSPTGTKLQAMFAGGIAVGSVDIHYANGAVYTGAYKDGARDGMGKMVYSDGGVYEGAWKDGRRDGKGYMVYFDGFRYEGEFKKNDREGQGTLLGPTGDRYEGSFKSDLADGKGSKVYALGGRYEGEWKAGKYDGSGAIVYAGGRRVEGQFKDGAPLGALVQTSAPAQTYALRTTSSGYSMQSRRDLVTGSPVPYEKSYQQLSADEKQAVKSMYPLMDEGDEPPYPLKGMQAIDKQLALAQGKLHVTGMLTMHVHVDSEGKAESVTVFSSPSADFTKIATLIVMLEKYKPALCAGLPCPMIFPVSSKFVDY